MKAKTDASCLRSNPTWLLHWLVKGDRGNIYYFDTQSLGSAESIFYAYCFYWLKDHLEQNELYFTGIGTKTYAEPILMRSWDDFVEHAHCILSYLTV